MFLLAFFLFIPLFLNALALSSREDGFNCIAKTFYQAVDTPASHCMCLCWLPLGWLARLGKYLQASRLLLSLEGREAALTPDHEEQFVLMVQ